MGNVAIAIKNVSMMFNLSRDKGMGLKEYVVKAIKRQLHYDEFWALQDVDVEIVKGEVVGILGLNGSGKSTLLKLVAGVFKPTKGSVTVHGSISPLLELGAGFDPEFSARENIYMNGAMFGHPPAHMDALYKEIIDFSELWDFEDVPMKNFSSGMFARLGFAVATQVDPDILIIDEILGVGDHLFLKKCNERMNAMLSQGTTVLMVSHTIESIKNMCTRAVLLDKGKVISVGDTEDVCRKYEQGAYLNG